MDIKEKSLYQQIHPIKLLTDISAGLLSLYIFWQHDIILGLLVAFVPSVVATVLLMRFVDLEKLKRSGFGEYVSKYMTSSMQALRLVGNFVMILGAWFHIAWIILVGLIMILFGWLRGVIFLTTFFS